GATEPGGNYAIGGAQDNGVNTYDATNGANGWLHAVFGDGGRCLINFNNPAVQYGETQRLSLNKSTDHGQTFSDATNGLTEAGDNNLAPFVAPIAMDPSTPAILAAGATSIWYTSNGAGQWSAIRGPVSGSPKCSAIAI